MGKRKRATKPPPKKKMPKLEKVFNCPFCGHENSVECEVLRSENIGKLECRLCGVRYSTTVGRLEEEIDVYYKWIDACDAANRGGEADEQVELEEIEKVNTAVEVAEEDEQDLLAKRPVKAVVDDDDVDDEV